MNISDILGGLRPKSKKAVVFSIMHDIQKKLDNGFTVREIHQALVDGGFEIDEVYFRKTIAEFQRKNIAVKTEPSNEIVIDITKSEDQGSSDPTPQTGEESKQTGDESKPVDKRKRVAQVGAMNVVNDDDVF